MTDPALGAGIYPPDEVPMARYLADPCPEPSLHPSRVTLLHNSTPRHARYAKSKPTRTTMAGICRHAILSGDDSEIKVMDLADYPNKDGSPAKRKNDAYKAAETAAIKQGKAVVSPEVYASAGDMIDALLKQLPDCAEHDGVFGTLGSFEHTLVWQEPNGVWCRCRPDWAQYAVAKHQQRVADYKTIAGLAHPLQVQRIAAQHGWAMKAAMTMRGMAILTGSDFWATAVTFFVQEAEAPYMMLPLAYSPEDIQLALDDFLLASEIWRDCLDNDEFDGYPPATMLLPTPVYARKIAQERQRLVAGDPVAYRRMLRSGSLPQLTYEEAAE